MNSAIKYSFLTAVWLPRSQLWFYFIKEKSQSFKVIHWAILIPKVIWKFTMTRPWWAVDKVYILFWKHRLESWWFFYKIVLGFNTCFLFLIIILTYSWSLLQCKSILAEIVHVTLDSSIQHLSLSNCIFIILTFIINWH